MDLPLRSRSSQTTFISLVISVSVKRCRRYVTDYFVIFTFLYSSTVLVKLGGFLSFLILYTDGRTPWTGDQPIARPLPTHRTTQTQNKRTQTSMPRVGFEPTIPVFEQEKTVHDLGRPYTGMRQNM
jgi:hypothetical protein